MSAQRRAGARSARRGARPVRGQPRLGRAARPDRRAQQRAGSSCCRGSSSRCFYLASMGIGLGAAHRRRRDRRPASAISYAAFIAPALLAVSAMNGAIYDSTWNVFFKMNYAKLYEGMLATSLGPLDVALGEILYALLRGSLYATGFMIIMQLFGLNLVVDRHPRPSGGAADRLRLRRRRHGGHELHEGLPADGLDQLRPAADVPLLGDVLPDHGLPRVGAVDRDGAAAVARRRADPRADDGRRSRPVMLVHIGYYVVMIAIGLVFTTKRLRALFLD